MLAASFKPTPNPAAFAFCIQSTTGRCTTGAEAATAGACVVAVETGDVTEVAAEVAAEVVAGATGVSRPL